MKQMNRYTECAPQIAHSPLTKAAKPFLKWAGGKGQLLSQLDEFLPVELDGREFTYIEPFVGGGAMLFHMLQKFPRINRVVINDINPHLVTAYRVIKNNPKELIECLAALERQYLSLEVEDAKKHSFLVLERFSMMIFWMILTALSTLYS